MINRQRTVPATRQAYGVPVVAKSRTSSSKRSSSRQSSSRQGSERRSKAKESATGKRVARPAKAKKAQERKKSSAVRQSQSKPKKSTRKSAKKSTNPILQRRKSATTSSSSSVQNRPQGSLEAKRKREKAKRKRRYDSAVEDLKERTHIKSVGKFTHWSTAFIGSYWHKSKITSALLLSIAVSLLYLIFTEPQFFVYAEDVTFSNLEYLYAEELYPDLEIDGWSIFWIQPNNVREAVIEHRYIADADVSIQFPARVIISVQEEKPTALWVTDEGPRWVLEDGSALPVRTTPTENLLQILDGQEDAAVSGSARPYLLNAGQPEASAAGEGNLAANINMVTNINPDVLQSALRLTKRYPGLDQITYNRGYGLNFTIPQRSEWVYWGDGSNFSQKLENMAAIHHIIAKNGATASIIDLRSPEKPYYR